MVKVVHGLVSEWKVHQVIAKNDGKHRAAPLVTWMPVSGIEISCISFFIGQRLIKVVCERKLNIVKNI